VTFNDGTGTVSSVQGIDQVYGSIYFVSGATGRFGVGDISVELLSKTYDFGDLNEVHSNRAVREYRRQVSVIRGLAVYVTSA